MGNRQSEFASFKLSLISFFILPFKIHIISLNCIIFVQHYLEDQVPHQVNHLHHLLWDCWIHEDVLQQTHYLNHLSDCEATLLSQKLLSLQLLKSSRLINKHMTIFSIPLISLAGGRVYHNYSFINVEIKLLIIIILVTNMYHLSLQLKVSWKIQSLHISPEGGLICFSLTSSSQPLSFANIILCRLDQVLWHRFVQQSNTHEHVSLIIPQHSYLEH